MTAMNCAIAAPLRPLTMPERATCMRLPMPRSAASCSCSTDREPMPRGGKFTTRENAVSSSGLPARRR